MIHKLHQKLALTLTAITLLSGCGPEVWNWEEEAKLDDGRSIKVKREVIFGGARLPWESNRLQSEYVLNFPSPDDPSKRFEYRGFGGLDPGALVFVKGVPYVLGITSRGDAIMYYDCPKPPYIVHRYDNGRWKRAELKDIPMTIKKMNLAFFSEGGFANAKAGGSASADQVAAWNESLAKRNSNPQWSDIVRPPENSSVEYNCNVPGKKKALMNLDEFKEQIRKSMPKNTE